MSSKKTWSNQDAIQLQHRQEKQEALEKQKRRKSYTKLNHQICAAVYDVFPELREGYDPLSGEITPETAERLAEITFVLRYFATHPRVLQSLKSGVLSKDAPTNV